MRRAADADLDTRHSFMATVGVEDPLAVDGLFARGADGASVIVYAARPDCEVQVHEADRPDGS